LFNLNKHYIIDYLYTVPSRPDSRSSNSSVNTIEDLSLAFNQTIALGEETLAIEYNDDIDSDDSDVEGI